MRIGRNVYTRQRVESGNRLPVLYILICVCECRLFLDVPQHHLFAQRQYVTAQEGKAAHGPNEPGLA